MPSPLFFKRTFAAAAVTIALSNCGGNPEPPAANVEDSVPDKNALTKSAPKETAAEFLARIEQEMVDLQAETYVAYWVRSTFLTPDTAVLAAKAGERDLALMSKAVDQAKQYIGTDMDASTERALNLLLLGTSMPAPKDPALQAELSQLATELEGMYGAGKACDGQGNCRDLETLERVLAQSKDYEQQLQAWLDWRTVSVPMRDKYQRFVELMNDGASEYGFDDLSQMWKAGYDMSSTEFEAEVERLWQQVAPLYESLHCYVRSELNQFYGDELVPSGGPIPAHLLGNMWAQSWSNIYPLVTPYPGAPSADVTGALVEQGYTPEQMTRMAEGFFTSLGLPSLPDSFYTNSLLEKPVDRDVVCHASAWDMGNGSDPRIKQCVEPTEEHLSTLHHELGHIYYYVMYKDQRPLFKTGAHDGFHEAIGDTIVLSMTPEYLAKMGLMEATQSSQEATINEQMKMALDKIAFLPFGKLMDQWRWQVFSGRTPTEDYNQAWWQLREQYQGIAPAVERTEADFDPGAKYHIPGNTPYTRYFLSFVIQFQFYQALCDAAGHEGPLHQCSFHENKVAGEKLGNLLALGASQPWPDAMEQITGTRTMDASAITAYFAPLLSWLEEQNQDQSCGW